MRIVRTRSMTVVAAGSLALVALIGLRSAHTAAADATVLQSPPTSAERARHGEYLVKTSGCDDCHTPWKMGDNGPEPDMSRRLMGHPAGLAVADLPGLTAPWEGWASATLTAWTGPWGRSFTANLTSDKDTGIGAWTEAQFIATIRNGRHLGDGRPLLPPMPWPAFRNYSDEDLGAIYAYLMTVPGVRNKVPEPGAPSGPAMPPPRAPKPVDIKTTPGPGDAVARGRYLVTARGCADCHTTMKMGAQGPEYDTTRALAGFDARGAVPPMPAVGDAAEVFMLEAAFAGAWGMSFAANLTPDPETGIGTWTVQQFMDTLRNGRHQGRGRQLLPPMPWQSFGQMTDADLQAIYAYLRTVTPVKNKVPEPIAPAAR